jgi:hypothetical protein
VISLVPVGAPVRVGAPGPWEPVGVLILTEGRFRWRQAQSPLWWMPRSVL